MPLLFHPRPPLILFSVYMTTQTGAWTTSDPVLVPFTQRVLELHATNGDFPGLASTDPAVLVPTVVAGSPYAALKLEAIRFMPADATLEQLVAAARQLRTQVLDDGRYQDALGCRLYNAAHQRVTRGFVLQWHPEQRALRAGLVRTPVVVDCPPELTRSREIEDALITALDAFLGGAVAGMEDEAAAETRARVLHRVTQKLAEDADAATAADERRAAKRARGDEPQ